VDVIFFCWYNFVQLRRGRGWEEMKKALTFIKSQNLLFINQISERVPLSPH